MDRYTDHRKWVKNQIAEVAIIAEVNDQPKDLGSEAGASRITLYARDANKSETARQCTISMKTDRKFRVDTEADMPKTSCRRFSSWLIFWLIWLMDRRRIAALSVLSLIDAVSTKQPNATSVDSTATPVASLGTPIVEGQATKETVNATIDDTAENPVSTALQKFVST